MFDDILADAIQEAINVEDFVPAKENKVASSPPATTPISSNCISYASSSAVQSRSDAPNAPARDVNSTHNRVPMMAINRSPPRLNVRGLQFRPQRFSPYPPRPPFNPRGPGVRAVQPQMLRGDITNHQLQPSPPKLGFSGPDEYRKPVRPPTAIPPPIVDQQSRVRTYQPPPVRPIQRFPTMPTMEAPRRPNVPATSLPPPRLPMNNQPGLPAPIPYHDTVETPVAQSIRRSIAMGDYSTMQQLIREWENVCPSGKKNSEMAVFVQDLLKKNALREAIRLLKDAKEVPTVPILTKFSAAVEAEGLALRNMAEDLWIPFHKYLLGTNYPLPPSFTDPLIRCFSAINHLDMVWNALLGCRDTSRLSSNSVSSKGLEVLLDSVVKDDNASCGGFSVCMALVMFFLTPWLPHGNSPQDSCIALDVRRELLVKIWLRCLDEEEDVHNAIAIGGQGGMRLRLHGSNSPVLDAVRAWIREMLAVKKFASLSKFLWYGYSFLPDLGEFLGGSFLLQCHPIESLQQFVKTTLTGRSMEYATEARPAVMCSLVTLCWYMSRNFVERRHWRGVWEIYETIFVPHGFVHVNMPEIPQYLVYVLEAALRLRVFQNVVSILQVFETIDFPTGEIMNRFHTILTESITVAMEENMLEVAVGLFWSVIREYSTDLSRASKLDGDLFNSLLVRCCNSGAPSVAESAVLLAVHTTTNPGLNQRLLVRPHTLRILFVENVRQGCCTSSSEQRGLRHKTEMMALINHAFFVSIHEPLIISAQGTKHTLNVCCDTTTEELQLLIYFMCENLRGYLLQQSLLADALLELCCVQVFPNDAPNIRQRDSALTGLYHIDASAQGVLTRMKSVLAQPLFLSSSISFVDQGGYLELDKNDLYSCIFYLHSE